MDPHGILLYLEKLKKHDIYNYYVSFLKNECVPCFYNSFRWVSCILWNVLDQTLGTDIFASENIVTVNHNGSFYNMIWHCFQVNPM